MNEKFDIAAFDNFLASENLTAKYALWAIKGHGLIWLPKDEVERNLIMDMMFTDPKYWYTKNIQEVNPPTEEFEQWWTEFYGDVDDYEDPTEFYTRKAFAWFGWVKRNDIAIEERKNATRDKVEGGDKGS